MSKVMLFRNEDFETAMRDQSLSRTNTYTKTKDYIIKLVDAVYGYGGESTGHNSDPYPSVETLLCDIHDNPEYASSILSTENTLATTNCSTVYDKKTKAKYAQMARSIKLSAFVSSYMCILCMCIILYIFNVCIMHILLLYCLFIVYLLINILHCYGHNYDPFPRPVIPTVTRLCG